MADFQAQYLAQVMNTPYIKSVARPGRNIVGLENYVYAVNVGNPIAIAATVQNTITTQGDSDFILESMSACVNITVNGDMLFNRNLTLQIQDLTTGKFLFSAATLYGLVAGAAGFPFMFPAPRVISPNGTLQFTVTNRDAGQAYNQMTIALQGTKVFYG